MGRLLDFWHEDLQKIYPTDAKTTVGAASTFVIVLVWILARTRLSFAHCDVRDRFSTENRCF